MHDSTNDQAPTSKQDLPKASYHELAQRTSAPITPEVVGRIKSPALLADLAYALNRMEVFGEMLSKIKGHVYYNKAFAPERPELPDTHNPADQIRRDWEVKMLHGVLGMISEAGELAGAIFNWLFQGQPLDKINLVEEIGDSRWFQEEAFEALGVTSEQVEAVNILKLMQRFGGRFGEGQALMRDLERERFALEGAFSKEAMATLPSGGHTEEKMKALAMMANAEAIVNDNETEETVKG